MWKKSKFSYTSIIHFTRDHGEPNYPLFLIINRPYAIKKSSNIKTVYCPHRNKQEQRDEKEEHI
jgi:hypothetical protein